MVRLRRTAVVLLLLALAASPAAADWLVMEDGTRVETRGPWRQDGRLIVFTSTEGSLVSLRASSVDLPASVEATRSAVEAADRVRRNEELGSERAPEPRQEVRRITNADIRPGASPATAAPGPEEAAAPPVAPDRGLLDIVDSRQSEDEFDGHLIVTGGVVNRAEQTAAAVGLTVLAYGADGELLASQRARLAAEALAPGQSTTFEVDFPDVFAAFALRFRPEASFLEVAPESDEGEDGGR